MGDTAILPLEHQVGMWSTEHPPKDLALAYALAVHKFQGSQHDMVILPVSTAASKMLYRNLLYTAISQAKKQIILAGSKEARHVACRAHRVPGDPSWSPKPGCCFYGARHNRGGIMQSISMAYPITATGAHIRQLRLEQKYSVQDLQTYLGFEHPQAIYHWQHGRNLPSVDNLYALSKLRGVPMDKIIVEHAA